MARWPTTDFVGGENVLENCNLANDAACWRACSVEARGCVSACGRLGVTNVQAG